MRTFCLSLFLAYRLSSAAYGAPAGKELAKEATQLEHLASQETNPIKSQELQRQACAAWNAAYDAGQRIEYQLFLGLCKQKLGDLEGAEAALRLFLIQAPPTHPDRLAAQGALDRISAERKVEQENVAPPALRVTSPVPIQETPTQWKRRALFAGGTLAGLGLVGGAIAFGVLRAQEEPPTIPIGQGGTPVEIP